MTEQQPIRGNAEIPTYIQQGIYVYYLIVHFFDRFTQISLDSIAFYEIQIMEASQRDFKPVVLPNDFAKEMASKKRL